jgi:hypothetical protein
MLVLSLTGTVSTMAYPQVIEGKLVKYGRMCRNSTWLGGDNGH